MRIHIERIDKDHRFATSISPAAKKHKIALEKRKWFLFIPYWETVDFRYKTNYVSFDMLKDEMLQQRMNAQTISK